MAELTINTDDIAAALREEPRGLHARHVELPQVGRIVEVGDGIARVSGLPDAAVNELLEFEDGTLGLALNLDESRSAPWCSARSTRSRKARRSRPPAASSRSPSATACSAGSSTPSASRSTARARSPTSSTPAHGDPGARHHGPQAGARAAADRHQGHRLDDADRPGPARARSSATARPARPPSRIDTILNQQGLGVKCIYVAIGQKGSTVAKTVATLDRARRDGLHGRRRRRPRPTRRRSSTSPRTPAARWASTGWRTASTRSSCTTTCPSRPRRTARCRCCCAARRAARRTPATCSTSTAACSSAPPS